MKLSGSTSRPPAGWRANVSMVRSMSPRSCTGPAVDSIDSDLAPSSSSFTRSAPPAAEVSRLNSSATRVTPGAIALSNSSHLPLAGKSKLISGPDQGPAFLHLTVWLAVRVLLYRGGLVSSAFRLLRRSGVGCHSQDPRFSSGSALWPSHDGIRRMRRTNLPRRPCRKTYGRHKDSKRTRLIHRPCGDIAPPVGGIHVFSCRVLLCTTRCEIRHDARHKCALTARSLLFAQSR